MTDICNTFAFVTTGILHAKWHSNLYSAQWQCAMKVMLTVLKTRSSAHTVQGQRLSGPFVVCFGHGKHTSPAKPPEIFCTNPANAELTLHQFSWRSYSFSSRSKKFLTQSKIILSDVRHLSVSIGLTAQSWDLLQLSSIIWLRLAVYSITICYWVTWLKRSHLILRQNRSAEHHITRLDQSSGKNHSKRWSHNWSETMKMKWFLLKGNSYLLVIRKTACTVVCIMELRIRLNYLESD